MGRRGPVVRDHTQSLGSRPIGRLLWWTCSQTTLSVGVYGIYALTNAWFVARGVGETALAAVNLVAPVILMLGAVSTTVGVGGASVVSRSLGAGRPDQAARAAGNAFVVFWLVALSVTVAGLLALDPLLTLLGGSGPTIAYARPYAAVIIGGSIFSTGFSALVRAEGRLRFSTMLWVVPVLVQIALDPLLIFVCGLGVAGAALGTVGGQAVSAGMAVWFFFIQRGRPYRIRPADLRPHPATIGAVLAVGAPSFLAGFGATLLAALINTTLAATGAVVLAAYAVCARLQTFVFTPQIGITQGIQPIVGYNAGRGLTGRVDRTLTLAMRATVIYGATTAALIALLARPLVGLFIGDQATTAVTVDALRIIAIGFVFAGIPPLISAYFQSLGRAAPSYLISIGTLMVIKVPLVLALGMSGPAGIWISLPIGEAISVVAAAGLLRRFGKPAVPGVRATA
ncbi:MATE family efflux transporter [Nonomuraea sp. NPDC052116]|uniref:MATE family efflux transporter n=1 Tax=Nonomuraea sp. NPDC052116 TaxID=3155665 RepID=UPI0034450F0A